jgi:triose/dihydroxyacetone kinase / FAD-AMP lyase (cyclizing)
VYRGLAGTVLVYKIAGALAVTGASIDDVYELAQMIAARVGTVGVARGHVQIPGTTPSEPSLGGDTIEIGRLLSLSKKQHTYGYLRLGNSQ